MSRPFDPLRQGRRDFAADIGGKCIRLPPKGLPAGAGAAQNRRPLTFSSASINGMPPR